MKILHKCKKINDANNKWCVYSHYDKNGRIEKYVLEALKRINQSGFKIHFVSTSPAIDEESLLQTKKFADIISIRENIGYDFGSYKLGIGYLFDNNVEPKQLLITNDSVYGPFFDLNKIIKQSNKFDFYGLTDSIDHAYHLQSYFIIYNYKIIKSSVFKEFWKSVELLDSRVPNFKSTIIQNYEVGGTQFFIKNGFSVGVAFGIDKIIKTLSDRLLSQIEQAQKNPSVPITKITVGNNPTHAHWEDLINMGFPYIKRELLTQNPTYSPLENWATVIDNKKSYDVKLIIAALINHFGCNDFLYTNHHPSIIASSLKKSGEITLNLSDQFKKWKRPYVLSVSKKFIFDSNHYLDINTDVKAAIEGGAKIDSVDHFKKNGHLENRPFKLNRVTIS